MSAAKGTITIFSEFGNMTVVSPKTTPEKAPRTKSSEPLYFLQDRLPETGKKKLVGAIVPVKQISDNFGEIISQLGSVFESAMRTSFGGFMLDSIDVALTASADGKIGILGFGAQVSGSASMTLNFKRAP